MTGEYVYLNGEFVTRRDAVIPVEDRGFLFGDGVYEVIRVYSGIPFLMERHWERLRRSLQEIGLRESILPCPVDELGRVSEELILRNQIGEGTVYIQITRGVASRAHAFPPRPAPTVLVMTYPLTSAHEEERARGVKCITVPDQRWACCYIKSVNLLPNCMAKQAAVESGCYEAILVKDGFVTEGSSSNVFAVKNGTVVTPPLTNYILPGITRGLVIELCAGAGLPVVESSIRASDLTDFDELFLTGTTTEVMPVVELNGEKIGIGTPGSVTRAIQASFSEFVHNRISS